MTQITTETSASVPCKDTKNREQTLAPCELTGGRISLSWASWRSAILMVALRRLKRILSIKKAFTQSPPTLDVIRYFSGSGFERLRSTFLWKHRSVKEIQFPPQNEKRTIPAERRISLAKMAAESARNLYTERGERRSGRVCCMFVHVYTLSIWRISICLVGEEDGLL